MRAGIVLSLLVSCLACSRSELTVQPEPGDVGTVPVPVDADVVSLCDAAERASMGLAWYLDLELVSAVGGRVPLCQDVDRPCVESGKTRTRWLSWNTPFVHVGDVYVSPMAGVYRKGGVVLFDLMGANSWVRLYSDQRGSDWRTLIALARQPLMPGAVSVSAVISFSVLPVRLSTLPCENVGCVDSQIDFGDQGVVIGPRISGEFPKPPPDRLARLPGRETIQIGGSRFALSDAGGAVLGCGRL